MRLQLTQEAQQDIEVAYQWYEARRAGLGTEFLDSLTHLFERIEEAPESFSRPEDYAGSRELRQGLPRRFPFRVLFELRADKILLRLFGGVSAIDHAQRANLLFFRIMAACA